MSPLLTQGLLLCSLPLLPRPEDPARIVWGLSETVRWSPSLGVPSVPVEALPLTQGSSLLSLGPGFPVYDAERVGAASVLG